MKAEYNDCPEKIKFRYGGNLQNLLPGIDVEEGMYPCQSGDSSPLTVSDAQNITFLRNAFQFPW